jgi:exopolysaccharide biosynthesis polyprenyl glycosylphosphotransferase
MPDTALVGRDAPAVFRRPDWLPEALLIGDAVIVAASVLLAYGYRFHLDRIPIVHNEAPAFGPYVAAIPVVVVCFLVALGLNQQYRSWRGRALVDQLFPLFSGVVLGALLVLAGMSLYRGFEFSRLTLFYTAIIATVLMTVERYLLRSYETRLRRRGIGTDRVLVVGTGPAIELLIQRLGMFPQYGFLITGVVDDRLPGGTSFAGAPVVGQVGNLPNLIQELRVQQVFLAAGAISNEQLLHLLKVCEDQQVEFKLVPDLLEIMRTGVEAAIIDGLPLIGIRRNRLRGGAAVLKRSLDLLAGVVLSIILSPVLLVIAVVVRLTSRGPVLFSQERVGLNGQRFTLYKFRTMVADAEADTGPIFARPGDRRRTPVGRFLRRFGLDELPQLYNILRGEMSLVGPRPERPFFVERFTGEVPRYVDRHQVRPGVTGWAQVNDLRGDSSIEERTIYDIYYVENWTLGLDLKILALTVFRILFQRHAY